MSTKIPSSNPTAYVGLKETNPPQLYFRNRAPTSTDYRAYDMGDIWIDHTALEAWILILKSGGIATWVGIGSTGALETLTGDSGAAVHPDGVENIDLKGNTAPYQNGVQITGDPPNHTLTFKDLRNITKYVVDPIAGETEYQTIQSAIDAANAAGGGSVYIRPATYTEALTLYDEVDLIGAVGGPEDDLITINGTHTPPTSGNIRIRNINLASATDVFNSVAAGSTNLTLRNCKSSVANGYLFDLLNWTGTITLLDLDPSGSTIDGGINNTGGSTVLIINSGIGAGIGNSMIVSGTLVSFARSCIHCPVSIQSTAHLLAEYVNFFEPITFINASTSLITNSYLQPSSGSALTHNSSGLVRLTQIMIDTATNPSIAGNGTITFGDVVFLQDQNIAGTVTKEAASLNRNGPIEIIPTDGSVNTNDAFLHMEIPGSTEWSDGIDNSDSDKYKIGPNADPSTGTSALSIKTTGDITFNETYEFPITDGTVGQVLITDGAGNVDWGDEKSSGEMVQQIFASSNAYQNINAAITYDDSIPQQTEGSQVLTATITPTSASNYLVITYNFSGSNIGTPAITAFFQDATANAFFAAWDLGATDGYESEKSHRIVAGTTSPTTIKVRMGGTSGAGFVYVNGDGAGRKMGGVSFVSLRIEEIKA